jgi:hypothetical protein
MQADGLYEPKATVRRVRKSGANSVHGDAPAVCRQEVHAMRCPNCTATFVLRADYAEHVQLCRPPGADIDVRDELLACLNAAADRLCAEFGEVKENRRTLVSAA